MSEPLGVREFVLARVSPQLQVAGLEPGEVPDDLDLVTAGILDSLGLIQLIGDIDERFGVDVDLEGLEPDSIGVVGPFCRYLEERVRAARAQT